MSRHGSMNRVYQVVWNVRRRVWQAAAETCGRQRRGRCRPGARAVCPGPRRHEWPRGAAADPYPLHRPGRHLAGRWQGSGG
ncbi:hypothetical protein HML84_12225 [Alcanivorax sp. IO_7]|nr:hypothetical protein HML84_12225 [Alcanivorax sp. IO_7]